MAHRKKIGDVFAIPLPDNTYAFGRLFQESCVAFYKHKGQTITDLPKQEYYDFKVCVHKSCFKDWIYIENRPFNNIEDARPPLYKMRDAFTGKYSIYDYGEIIPATEEECKDLEVCAVWESEHIIERLMGNGNRLKDF